MDLMGRLGRVEKVDEGELVQLQPLYRRVGLEEGRAVLKDHRVGGGAEEPLLGHCLEPERSRIRGDLCADRFKIDDAHIRAKRGQLLRIRGEAVVEG